jgi:hypothetical protein
MQLCTTGPRSKGESIISLGHIIDTIDVYYLVIDVLVELLKHTLPVLD